MTKQPLGAQQAAEISRERADIAAKVWVVHRASHHAAAEALAGALQQHGHTARSVRMIEGARDLTQEALEGGFEQLRQGLSAFLGTKILPDVDAFAARPPRLLIVDTVESARMFDRLRRTLQLRVRVVAWLDDFETSAAWSDEDIDAMIAPTCAQLRHAGLDPDRADQGLVIGPSRPEDVPPDAETFDAWRVAARSSMNAQNACVAMVDGACLHPQDIPAMVRACARASGGHEGLRWVLYYGAQTANGEAMRAAAKTYGLRALMFGENTPVHRVLPGVDVMITPEKSRLYDLAAWSALPILRVVTGAEQHPLALHGRMTEISSFDELTDALRRLSTAPRTPLTEHEDLVSPGDIEAIAQQIAAWVSRHLHVVNDPPRDSPPTRDAFAFEEIGYPVSARTTSVTSRPMSESQRKAQMVALIQQLRAAERAQEEAVHARDVWIQRLQDAEEAQEEDLIAAAQQRVDDALRRVKMHHERVAELHDARDRLRGRKTHGLSEGPSTKDTQTTADPQDLEARFVRLEQQRQLRNLRARMPKDDPSGGSSR